MFVQCVLSVLAAVENFPFPSRRIRFQPRVAGRHLRDYDDVWSERVYVCSKMASLTFDVIEANRRLSLPPGCFAIQASNPVPLIYDHSFFSFYSSPSPSPFLPFLRRQVTNVYFVLPLLAWAFSLFHFFTFKQSLTHTHTQTDILTAWPISIISLPPDHHHHRHKTNLLYSNRKEKESFPLQQRLNCCNCESIPCAKIAFYSPQFFFGLRWCGPSRHCFCCCCFHFSPLFSFSIHICELWNVSSFPEQLNFSALNTQTVRQAVRHF